ncbi:MAG: hypothetical protein ABI352_02210, partial [Candidatus Dormibacter sp.]
GPTDADNLVLLCRHHHWCVHEGGWTLVHTEDGGILALSPVVGCRHPCVSRGRWCRAPCQLPVLGWRGRRGHQPTPIALGSPLCRLREAGLSWCRREARLRFRRRRARAAMAWTTTQD